MGRFYVKINLKINFGANAKWGGSLKYGVGIYIENLRT